MTLIDSKSRIDSTAVALRGNGFDVRIAGSAAGARDIVRQLIPEGAEVSSAASVTLEQTGILEDINASGRYDAVRPRLLSMDRRTQARAMRKLGAAPDVVVGSVGAVTENGWLVAASATGSQLAPYTFGAERVILVAGEQKLVGTVDEAFRRLEETVLPRENVRVKERYGHPNSFLAKILVWRQEVVPGRTTVVLVREPLGF